MAAEAVDFSRIAAMMPVVAMYPAALKFLFICIEVVLLFNLLIVVHELGHFLAARWRGLVVDKFAIWFGKPIWKKTIGGVEYQLGSIPAGGFVAIPQLAPMEAIEGETNHDRKELPAAKPLDKIIVAAAGPVFSFGLAIVFACIVWVVGKPVNQGDMTTVIGYVVADGPAAKAGLQPGDKILSINGHEVDRFTPMGDAGKSIMWNIARAPELPIPILFERDGVDRTVEVTPLAPPREGWGRHNLRQIQILPAETPRIAQVFQGSPAVAAGLKDQDLVIAANGQKLLSFPALADILSKNGLKPITLTIQRGGRTFPVTVTPRVPEHEKTPHIGIQWDERGAQTISHPKPWEQIKGSVSTMWETISAIFTRGSGISVEQLSGPVGIMRLYYLLFQSPDGWQLALWFSVILNVNLALMNLLPIPVLDGGHILLALIEALFRRPISLRILEMVQTGCAVGIIGFIMYVSFFDVMDLPFPWNHSQPTEKLEFSASPSPNQTP